MNIHQELDIALENISNLSKEVKELKTLIAIIVHAAGGSVTVNDAHFYDGFNGKIELQWDKNIGERTVCYKTRKSLTAPYEPKKFF